MNEDKHSQKKTDVDSAPPTVNKPLDEEKFTRFYKIMLILSTMGTSMAVVSIINLPATINLYATAPVNSILGLASYVVTLLSVVALILLWRKDINGLYLKLGAYATTSLIAIGLLFTADFAIKDTTEKILDELAKQGQSIDSSLIANVVNISIYTSIISTIVISVVFGMLWLFAWRKQAKTDAEA